MPTLLIVYWEIVGQFWSVDIDYYGGIVLWFKIKVSLKSKTKLFF